MFNGLPELSLHSPRNVEEIPKNILQLPLIISHYASIIQILIFNCPVYYVLTILLICVIFDLLLGTRTL